MEQGAAGTALLILALRDLLAFTEHQHLHEPSGGVSTQTGRKLLCRPTVVQHQAKRVDSKRAGARNRAQVLLDRMRGQARAGRDRLASLQQRCLHHSRHSRACSRSRKWYRLRQVPVSSSPVHAQLSLQDLCITHFHQRTSPANCMRALCTCIWLQRCKRCAVRQLL